MLPPVSKGNTKHHPPTPCPNVTAATWQAGAGLGTGRMASERRVAEALVETP
jgi:hypothetical protein